MPMTTEERFAFCLDWFERNMPVAESELKFGNAFQLLVAVMLSAQCTDKRVNEVTPALFEAYPTAERMSKASVEDILQYIKSVSYPNSKALHLKQMSVRLTEVYCGIVPDSVDDLQTLVGVGRKTANVVCAVWFGKPTMAVDTHIFRVSERIGLTTGSKNPLQTEKQLVKHIPENVISRAHHQLLLHGRYVCRARNPRCADCGIKEACRHYESLFADK